MRLATSSRWVWRHLSAISLGRKPCDSEWLCSAAKCASFGSNGFSHAMRAKYDRIEKLANYLANSIDVCIRKLFLVDFSTVNRPPRCWQSESDIQQPADAKRSRMMVGEDGYDAEIESEQLLHFRKANLSFSPHCAWLEHGAIPKVMDFTFQMCMNDGDCHDRQGDASFFDFYLFHKCIICWLTSHGVRPLCPTLRFVISFHLRVVFVVSVQPLRQLQLFAFMQMKHADTISFSFPVSVRTLFYRNNEHETTRLHRVFLFNTATIDPRSLDCV